MSPKRYIDTDKVLTYEELKLQDKFANDYYIELLRQGKVLTVFEFFEENPDLEQRLRETSLFGYPSNALFALLPFCSGFCNQVSRVFAIYSGEPTATVVTGINESIALTNYGSSYSKNPLRAHHTWVELTKNGNEYVIDLADQKVFLKDDYYTMHNYKDEDLAKTATSAAILQEFTPYSFVCLANRLANLTYHKTSLLEGYDNLISALFINHKGMVGRQVDYVINELENAQSKLIQNGITFADKADATIVDYLASKTDYMFNYSNGVSQFLQQELSANPQKYETFNDVFPQTKEMAERSGSMVGPLEWIGHMSKQFD